MTSLSPASSSSSPVPFAFKNHQIRTVVNDDGAPWFVARDVANALAMDWSGKTLRSIPSEWAQMGKFPIRRKNGDVRLSRISLISEPAVYKLAFRSNKPEADEFTNWVASVVLPSIRKTGAFEAKAEPKALSTVDDRKPLRALVHAWALTSGVQHQALWSQVRANFNLSRIDELPVAWIPDALAFVQSRIDTLQVKALPPVKNESTPTLKTLLDVLDVMLLGLLKAKGHHAKTVMGKGFLDLAYLTADTLHRASN